MNDPVTPLPIDPRLPEIVAALRSSPNLVLTAPPGAGKTTRVPRALLDADPNANIVVLEPRRLAAKLAARRVSSELGERVGERIGYQVRFDDATSPRTRIRFVTEGILTRRLLVDPTLAATTHVLLDEVHERHLVGDLALALLSHLQRTSRPDLRLVAMSATMSAELFSGYLSAPVIAAEGRLFDIAIEHLPSPDDRPLASQVASALRRLAVDGLDGDVLVFLPGASEIRRARQTCEKVAQEYDLELLPLHGDLSPKEQDRAVTRGTKRKVLLSTNIAESSVTIEGIIAVIDSGLVRIVAHAPWSGLPTSRIERTSRASAIQRANRAGRTRPGRCLRLYTRGDFETRPAHDVPEIFRADLAQTLLELAALGLDGLAWLEAPKSEASEAARLLLRRLGALDSQSTITPDGRSMLRFALHPRVARILVEAERRGVGSDGAVVAALLAERDLRVSSGARFDGMNHGHEGATERSDLLLLLELYREAEASGFSSNIARVIGLDMGALATTRHVASELSRALSHAPQRPKDLTSHEQALLKAVLTGFPDRVARRVRGRALALGGGGSAELSEESAVRDAPWMVAIDAEERRGAGIVVRRASAIEPEWLLEHYIDTIEETNEVRWNAVAERAEGKSRMLYDGLLLDESEAGHGAEAELGHVLAEAATALGARAFAPEGTLDRWLARVRFTASIESHIEALTDEQVKQALVAQCEGKRSFAELRRESLVERLRWMLGANAGVVERLAPEKMELPSGRNARIQYEEGKPPWVESYLQDFFGTLDTPRIGQGRVALVVHLLAPNKRAVQITTDLAGFWERHYPAIKKELARKYPKHNWPDEPRKAVAKLRK